MRSSRHILHVDLIHVFSVSQSAIAGVVAEAILDSDDNPFMTLADVAFTAHRRAAHQRFVKTTPKPNATKKSNGELVGELLLLLAWLVAGGADTDVWAGGEVVVEGPPACGLRATNLKASPTACSMIATIVAAVVLDGRVVVVVLLVGMADRKQRSLQEVG